MPSCREGTLSFGMRGTVPLPPPTKDNHIRPSNRKQAVDTGCRMIMLNLGGALLPPGTG